MPAKSSSRTATPPYSSPAADTARWRDAFIDSMVVLGIALVAITETLSTFNGLTTAGVFAAWGIVAVALSGWFLCKRTKPALIARARVPEMTREDRYYIAFIAFICLVTLVVALYSPPNTSDAHTYHLPRVLRWIQDGTVDFYPTHSERQLWIQPGWEYFQVHLQLFAGTDTVANLLEWSAMLGCPVIASVIARELGATRRGQLLAALFTVSIPMGIAQASGSQVDLFTSFWVATTIALLLRIRRLGIGHTTIFTAVLFGAAVGISVLSKATSVLFILPFVLWIGLPQIRSRPFRSLGLGAIATVFVLAINAGHMSRNKSLYGNSLAVPGADGVVNTVMGPRTLVSNIVRNAVLQLPTPSDRVNAAMTRAIVRMLAAIGVDANDRRTTFADKKFEVPAEWDDEGQGSNQLHFVIIIVAGICMAWKYRKEPATKYFWCVLAGALLFCLVLKWQPWHSRLQLPLFVIAGGAVGAAVERHLAPNRLRWIAIALALIAIHPTFRNNMRPIIVRRPMFTVPYDERLFTDGHPEWRTYAAAADAIASFKCTRIGLIETRSTWEFPVWKMIERRTGTRPEIRHVGVMNVSRLTATDRDRSFSPCAVLQIEPIYVASRNPLGMLRYFPEGIPQMPRGYKAAWKQDFITIYLPSDS